MKSEIFFTKSNWIILLLFVIIQTASIELIYSQKQKSQDPSGTGKEASERIILKIKTAETPAKCIKIRDDLIKEIKNEGKNNSKDPDVVKSNVRKLLEELIDRFSSDYNYYDEAKWLREITSELLDKEYLSVQITDNDIKIKNIKATGLSSGHIANIEVENSSSNQQDFIIQAAEIPSEGLYQSFVIPTDIKFTIPAKSVISSPVIGYCTSPKLPPPPTGADFPNYKDWNSKSALIEPVKNIVRAATELQSKGRFVTPFSRDPKLENAIITQYAIWKKTDPEFDLCESINLSFDKFVVDYKTQKSKDDSIKNIKPFLDHGILKIVESVIRTFRLASLSEMDHQEYIDSASRVVNKTADQLNPEIINTIKLTGTGRTTGHIANLNITNPTNKPVTLHFGNFNPSGANSFYIPSDGQYQPYIVPHIPDISLDAGQSKILPIENAFCVDIHSKPVPPGVEMFHPSKWTTIDNYFETANTVAYDPKVVQINMKSSLPLQDALKVIGSIKIFDKPICSEIPSNLFNPQSYFPIDPDKTAFIAAPMLLDALTKISKEFDNLKEKGQISTPFSNDPEKERESVIQQTFWIYSSELTGKYYDKKDFNNSAIRQYENNTGKTIEQSSQIEKEKLSAGVDAFWNTFEALGSEAKVLDRKPEKSANNPTEAFWNIFKVK